MPRRYREWPCRSSALSEVRSGPRAHRQGQVVRHREGLRLPVPRDDGGDVFVHASTPSPTGVEALEARRAGRVRRGRRQEGRAGPVGAAARPDPVGGQGQPRKPAEDMAVIVEDLIKVLDDVGQRAASRPLPRTTPPARSRRCCAPSPTTSTSDPLCAVPCHSPRFRPCLGPIHHGGRVYRGVLGRTIQGLGRGATMSQSPASASPGWGRGWGGAGRGWVWGRGPAARLGVGLRSRAGAAG